MKNLKKTMAAAVLSLAAAGAAMAQSITPVQPNLTDDEKAVVKLYHDFQACAARKQEELAAKQEAAVAIAREQAKAVADARAGAGDEATRNALQGNLTEEEKTQILDILKNGETQFFTQILASKAMSKEKDPAQACLEELNINVDEATQKIRNLMEKHGPGILAPQ